MAARSDRKGWPWGIAVLVVAVLLVGWPHLGKPGSRDWPSLDPLGKDDRLLIVAPHVDDEALGAGAYAAAALRNGAAVYVVYVTSGDCNRTSAEIMDFTLRPGVQDYLSEGSRRIREARAAMSRLGLPPDHLFFLGYPDRGIQPMLQRPDQVIRSPGTGKTAVPYPAAVSPGAEYRLVNLEKDLHTVLDKTRPTVVALPVPFDAHPDHSASGRITLMVLEDAGLKPHRLGYLIHARHFPSPFRLAPGHPLLPPHRFADEKWALFPLTPADERAKKRVLIEYRSQRRDPYLFVLMDAFVRRNELFVRM
ncbi:MAG: PIG-L family deacetylase [Acidobacteria bacterium]|nr:PIG-L family deacetylase [Acidobacteriota bacterium]